MVRNNPTVVVYWHLTLCLMFNKILVLEFYSYQHPRVVVSHHQGQHPKIMADDLDKHEDHPIIIVPSTHVTYMAAGQDPGTLVNIPQP